jgi:alpha-1,2-mannosyltransferase
MTTSAYRQHSEHISPDIAAAQQFSPGSGAASADREDGGDQGRAAAASTFDQTAQPTAEPTVRSGLRSWWWSVAAVSTVAAAMGAHHYFLGWWGEFGLFGNGVDTVVYRHGAETVLQGGRLYEFALFEVGLPFTYPPFAALSFIPLTWMTLGAAVTAVQVINLVLVYAAVVGCWRILGYRGPRMWLASIAVAAALTWLEPVRMTIWLGQINLLLLVLVLADLGRDEGSRLRGLGVGVAAGLKLTPAFFVLHLATLRQWKPLAYACAGFAATVAAGVAVIPADAVRYWTSEMTDSARIGALASPANQSLHGVLARAWPGHTPPVWVWLPAGAAVAAAGLWAALRAHRGGARLQALTVCGLTTPLAAPFAWGHHWVWCIPLTVLALDYAYRRRQCWWALVLPVAAAAPMIGWFFTDYRGIKAIGIFMLEGPPWFETIVQCAYPILCLTVIAATATRYRPTTPPVDTPPVDTPSVGAPVSTGHHR